MWWKISTLLFSLLALSMAFPNPQDEDQDLLSEIAGVAQDAERYGGIEADVDPATLSEIFGTPNKDFTIEDSTDDDDQDNHDGGVPKDVIVDDTFKQCSSYAESGYRCVPYYSCDDGEIIIDGAGLFTPRFGGLNDVELNPETSKCPGNFEMCCRHPDWIGLPINQPVPIKKPDGDDLINNVIPDDKDTDDEQVPEYPEEEDEGLPDVEIEEPETHSTPDDEIDEPTDTHTDDSEDEYGQGNEQPETHSVPDTDEQEPAKPRYQPRCGQRNNNGIGVRIANTNKTAAQAQFGEWPHMCAVLNQTEIGGVEHFLYVCGGSLIAPNVVMTAAHCVNKVTDVSKIQVRCGEWDTQDEVEPLVHQDRRALQIVIHPAFGEKNLQNDFAIIVMEEEFELDRHIDTICLPDQNGPTFDGNNCFASGWGKDTFGKEGEYQVILKQVELNMVGHDECQDRLRTTRLGDNFELHESFNCALGDEGQDTCTGDGGGPLVCPGYDGYYYQSGIIAWGVGCAEVGIPGVYANVSEGLCFIDYATKCVLGQDADLYGLKGCARWGKRQYCSIKDEIETLDSLIEQTTQLRAKGKLFRKQRGLKKLLAPYEAMVNQCYQGSDLDCTHFDYFPEDYEDDLDLSIHAKITDSQEEKKEEEFDLDIRDIDVPNQ